VIQIWKKTIKRKLALFFPMDKESTLDSGGGGESWRLGPEKVGLVGKRGQNAGKWWNSEIRTALEGWEMGESSIGFIEGRWVIKAKEYM